MVAQADTRPKFLNIYFSLAFMHVQTKNIGK